MSSAHAIDFAFGCTKNDGRGNVMKLGNQSFTYDLANQPTAAFGAKIGNYVYDGNLKRVKTTVGGQTLYNVYDASGALVYIDDLGTGTKTDYIHGMGRTLARIKNNVITYLHNDHLGSAATGTNQSGTVLWTQRYTPYGEELNAVVANDNQAGYTGHIRDKATGLNYMQARYYDPVIGRFLSVDPVTFMDTGSPSYFNRYAYVSNDPVNMIDPTGMYGRGPDGGGFTDDEWNKFDAAQQQASKDIGTALGTLDAAKNGNADAISAFQNTFGSDGDLNTNIDKVAGALTGIKSALDDDGSNYQAFASAYLDSAANGDVNGTQIEIGTQLLDSPKLKFGIVHEAGHNIGLEHPASPTGEGFSKTPYRFGTAFERKAYSNMTRLNPSATFGNPDHVASFLYP